MNLNVNTISKTQTIIETKHNKIMIDHFNGEEIVCIQSKPKTYEDLKKCMILKQK